MIFFLLLKILLFFKQKKTRSFKTLKKIAENLGYNESELQLFDDDEDKDSEKERQRELDKIETHSLFDSTTIASKDDDESDYDELSNLFGLFLL